jgi:hypothetical protein
MESVMNQQSAETLQRLMQDRYPDAVVTVTAQDGGAEIEIFGPAPSPGLSGSGKDNNIKLVIGDNGPFMRSLVTNIVRNSGAFP